MKTPYFAFLSQSALDVDCGRICPLDGSTSTRARRNHSIGCMSRILHPSSLGVRLTIAVVLIR
jgi:hypothetical protein